MKEDHLVQYVIQKRYSSNHYYWYDVENKGKFGDIVLAEKRLKRLRDAEKDSWFPIYFRLVERSGTKSFYSEIVVKE